MELSEVRAGIDNIDKEIKELFIKRMQYSDQVARIKAQTGDNILKPEREAAIIEKNSADVDESIKEEYTALVKRVMEVSRKYQYGRTLELRSCFPFEYTEAAPEYKSFAALSIQASRCKEIVDAPLICVKSYHVLGELVSAGEADAGITLIDQTEKAHDSLRHVLVDKGLYINDISSISAAENGTKLVYFSKKLYVSKKHNRVSLVFKCTNKPGSLAGILTQISDYGINITRISLKNTGNESTPDFEFYLELSMNMLDRECQALLFQLYNEALSLRLLGSYTI